jgi:hypothetical protein
MTNSAAGRLIHLREPSKDAHFPTSPQRRPRVSADPSGLAFWGSLLNQGMTGTTMAAAIMMSPECHTMQVMDLYNRILHRRPDPNGLSAFVSTLAQGSTLMQAEAIMMDSPEYFATRGGSTDAGFLLAVYQDTLNRAPDATGAATFSQGLNSGVSRVTVALTILTSTEARQNEVQNMYTTFLHRAPDPAGFSAFFTALQAGMPDAMAEALTIGSDEFKNQV